MRISLFVTLLFFLVSAYAAVTIPDVVLNIPENGNDGVSKSDLEQHGYLSLSHALKSYPGIYISDLYGDGSQLKFSLRGFGDNSNANMLVLIDGIPFRNIDMGAYDLSMFGIEEIEQINIISSSNSALYGDQAVGGVINIIPRQIYQDHVHADVLFGSFNARKYQGHVDKEINDRLDIGVDGGHSSSDQYRDHNASQTNRFSVSSHFHNAVDKGNLYYHYNNHHLQYPGALTSVQYRQDPTQSSNQRDYIDDETHLLYGNDEHRLSDTWTFALSGLAKIFNGNGVLSTDFHEEGTTIDLRSYMIGAQEWRHLPVNLTFGVESLYAEYQYDDHNTLDSDVYEKEISLYGQATFPVSLASSMTFGASVANNWSDQQTRVDDSSGDNTASAMTAVYDIQLLESTHLYSRLATNYRFPKAEENALSENQKALDPQKGISYEIGLKQNMLRFSSQLSIYALYLNDEIAYVPSTDSETFGFNENLPQTRRLGGIASEKWHVNSFIMFNAGFQVVSAKFIEGRYSGNTIPAVPEAIANIGMELSLSDRIKYYAEARYTGQCYASDDNENRSDELGGYTIYNIALHYQFNEWYIKFNANNLFDKRYSEYTVVNNTGNGLNTYYYPGEGRSFYVTVGLDI